MGNQPFPPTAVYTFTFLFALLVTLGIVVVVKYMRDRTEKISKKEKDDVTSLGLDDLLYSIKEQSVMLQTTDITNQEELKTKLQKLRESLLYLRTHLPVKSGEIQEQVETLLNCEENPETLISKMMELHHWIDIVKTEIATL